MAQVMPGSRSVISTFLPPMVAAVFQGTALARQYGNLLGAAAHHAVMWDECAELYGRQLMAKYKAG